MAAVRWTGFLGSSLGKLCRLVSAQFAIFAGGRCVPLDLSPVTGSALARQEGQRAVAGGFELPVGHGEFDVLWLVVSKLSEVRTDSENEYSLWEPSRWALNCVGAGAPSCQGRTWKARLPH